MDGHARPVAAALVLALIAQAAPAAPRLKPEPRKAPDLAGTTWTGTTFEMQTMVLTFEPGGRLAVTYNGGKPIEHCGWSQDADEVHVHINKMYLTFDGKFVGDRIEGECHNRAGKRWRVTLTQSRE